MIRRWIQHDGMRIVRGNGAPPDNGDVYFVGEVEEESASIVNGVLIVQGVVAPMGTYTFEMLSGQVYEVECDNAGVVIRRGGSS